VSNIFKALPPLFRPRPAKDLSLPNAPSKVPDSEPHAPAEAPVRSGDYAFPWPDRLPELGSLHVQAFDFCALCGRGSWVAYGSVVLCLTCAKGQLGA